MKRKYYFIDTENVGDRWFDLMKTIKKKDRVLVFYTVNHSKGLEEVFLRQVHHPQILWLECMIGNNALDYQLIGVLSYLTVRHPKASFCIYSNDKGYDIPIDFWRERGIRISRKTLDTKKKAGKKGKKGKKAGKNKKDGKADKNTLTNPVQTSRTDKANGEGASSSAEQASKTAKINEKESVVLEQTFRAGKMNEQKSVSGPELIKKAGQVSETGKNNIDLSDSPETITKDGQLIQDQKNKEKTGNKNKKKKKKQPEQNAREQKISVSFLHMLQNQQKLTERQYLAEIGKCVAASDLQGWCRLLIAVFGQKDGGEWYQKIRRDAQMREQLSNNCMKNVHRRCIHAVALALHANGLDAGGAEAACSVIRSHSYRDFHAIKIDLDKRPEFKQQNKYYKVLRPLIALLQTW